MLALSLLTVLSLQTTALETSLVVKDQLSFEAESLDADRNNERFTPGSLDAKLKDQILNVVQQTTQLIPSKYHRPRLTINIEREAVFTQTGHAPERLPLSTVFTVEQPQSDSVKFSIDEIKNDNLAIQTTLAHELGHIIMNWACRAEKVIPPGEFRINHWSGTIYEGVADYIAAMVTGSTVLMGQPGEWHARDILKFKTLDEARRLSLPTTQLIIKGFREEGYVPQYRTYTEMSDFLSKLPVPKGNVGDAYVEAPWLAGQLYQLGQSHGMQTVFQTILTTAISGEPFDDAEKFLSKIQGDLVVLEAERLLTAIDLFRLEGRGVPTACARVAELCDDNGPKDCCPGLVCRCTVFDETGCAGQHKYTPSQILEGSA